MLPRQKIAADVKSLDQDVRGKMRRMGIRFGAYHIYLPLTLKPAPRELALILYALKNGGLRQPGVTDIPSIVLSGRTSFEIDPEVSRSLYEIAGFKVAGKRAVRVDILERLADIIRPLISFDAEKNAASLNPIEAPDGAAKRNGFEVTVQMTSLLGCAGDDFSAILESLGYRVERTQIVTDDTPKEDTQKSDTDDLAKLDGAPKQEIDSSDTEALAKLDAPAKPDEAEPEEPKFHEIWFPVSRRPQHQNRPAGQNTNKKRDHKANNNQNRPNQNRAAQKQNKPRHKPREKPMDPDSPFAALAALKLKGSK